MKRKSNPSVHEPRKSRKSGNVPTLKLDPKPAATPTPVEAAARAERLRAETDPEVFVPKMDLPREFPVYQEPGAQAWVPKMELPREFPAVEPHGLE